MIPLTYNVRSLVVRKTTTAAAVFGIALVVFVLASSLMLSAGVNDTLSRTGGRDAAIVLRKGVENELSSSVDQGKIGMLLASPGVRKSADGRPMGTGEVSMIVMLEPHATPGGLSNVQVRGVEADVQRFRPEVSIIEGRALKAGADEAIVGRAIAGRFVNLELNGVIEPKKNRPLKIVGIFDAGGSSYESEVWADVDTVKAAFGREGMVSSVRVKLESAGAFDAFKASVEGDKRLGLEAWTEEQWGEKQSQFLSTFMSALGFIISFFFSIGAMIGAMITMYASVAGRQREIGTLRALGFPRRQILFSFIFESLVVAIAGGVVGSLAAMALTFVKFSTLNFATFSELVFTFKATPDVFVTAFIFALVMGLMGGLLPAVRAARMSPVNAMRN